MHVLRRTVETWTTVGDYGEDAAFRARFKKWLADLWSDKDARLEAMLDGHRAVAGEPGAGT
jgi:hypothetical protein